MRRFYIAILFLLLSLGAHADNGSGCASTIKELRILAGDPIFSNRWTEISMDDGKPMVASIIERNGKLLIEFIKTGEGLWAEISGVICKTGLDLEARISKEQIVIGPAANWMLSLAIANGGVFTLRRHLSNQLQIETQGWSGRFVPTVIN
jgi:hypothetical protein